MFDDSIPLHSASAQRWTVPLSAAGEIALAALLALVPLYYSDALPLLQSRTEVLAAPVAPAPTPPVQTRARPSAPSSAPRPFIAPARIPQTIAEHIVDTSADATPAVPQIGVPGAIGDGAATDNVLSSILASTRPAPPKPAPTPKARGDNSGPIRVSLGVQQARLLRKVFPIYPALARQARVSGTVKLVGIVGKDGSIRSLQVISGHPLLTAAALDAVRQWVYKPTLLNGEPVEVIAPIEVTFTLSQ